MRTGTVAVTMSGADHSVQTYDADTYQVQTDRADGGTVTFRRASITTEVHLCRPGGDLHALCHPPDAGGQPGGGGPGADGPLAAAGAAGLLPAVRVGVLPVHHPAHRAAERHRRQDGGAGLPVGVRGDAPGRDRPAGPQPGPDGPAAVRRPHRPGGGQPGPAGGGGAGAGAGPAADGLFLRRLPRAEDARSPF